VTARSSLLCAMRRRDRSYPFQSQILMVFRRPGRFKREAKDPTRSARRPDKIYPDAGEPAIPQRSCHMSLGTSIVKHMASAVSFPFSSCTPAQARSALPGVGQAGRAVSKDSPVSLSRTIAMLFTACRLLRLDHAAARLLACAGSTRGKRKGDR